MYRLEHRSASGMNVGTGRHAQPALQGGGEVGTVVAQNHCAGAYLGRPRGCGRVGADVVVEPPGPYPFPQCEEFGRGLRVGEEVVLLGRHGGDEITVTELAARAGTIPWEALTAITKRVPRVYIGATSA